MCTGACNLKAGELIAVNQNVGQFIVQAELQESITGGSMTPAVFIRMGNNQTTLFCCCFESFVVVGIAPAAILNPVDIIMVVYHLMQQCGGNFFNRAGQCTSSDIDFMGCTVFGKPCIIPK